MVYIGGSDKDSFENLKGRCGWELLDILQRKNKN